MPSNKADKFNSGKRKFSLIPPAMWRLIFDVRPVVEGNSATIAAQRAIISLANAAHLQGDIDKQLILAVLNKWH